MLTTTKSNEPIITTNIDDFIKEILDEENAIVDGDILRSSHYPR